MRWRRRGAPRSGITRSGAAALLLLGSTTLLQAADTQFRYIAIGRVLYTTDVFRTGTSTAQDDVISLIGLDTNLSSRTARSTTNLNVIPEFVNYANIDELDSFNYRVRGSWYFTPGRRSSVGALLGIIRTTQQIGFQDFTDVGGDQGSPVVQTTRRTIRTIEPYYRLNVSRRWSMETRALLRSQSFNSPNLIDSSTVGLSFSAETIVRRADILGGVMRYGKNFFKRGGSSAIGGTAADEVVNVEAYWAQEIGATFKWRIAVGSFQVVSGGSSGPTEPSFRLQALWLLRRNGIEVRYDNSFSAQTGTVGTLRREVGAVVYRRLWGRGFTTSALASYLRLDTLQNSVQKGSLDGYSVGLDASYTSRSAWGYTFQVRRLQQEQTSGRTLDYEQAFVAVTFTPK